MKFGQVEDPSIIDFKLPDTAPETFQVLEANKNNKPLEIAVGCAKWNKNDLKGFYPRGVKDELKYYASQFNSIELNATFYNSPSLEQVAVWRDKTPDDFKFFPKLPQSISHYSRLLNAEEKLMNFVHAVRGFGPKLGMAFLQMHDNYKPKDFARLENFLHQVPKGFPLGLEVRNTEWFTDKYVFHRLCLLLQETEVANVIVDTAGRRDMLHLRLTTPAAFVRFVGANHHSDYTRLDEWVERIIEWKNAGLQQLYFFIHQNVEIESPLLAAHFINRLNLALGCDLKIPVKPEEVSLSLF